MFRWRRTATECEQRRRIIGLVNVGGELPFRLLWFARRLTGLQREFSFRLLGAITADRLGAPDVADCAYSATVIHKRLYDVAGFADCAYVIGITRFSVAGRSSGGPAPERDYFSQSDFKRVAVISVHESVRVHGGPTTSVEQYAAFLVICELLILMAGKDLSHTTRRRCLFDECQDRSELRYCIAAASICPGDCATLTAVNVSDETINASKVVLRWCRTNRWWPFVVRFTFTNPVSAFSLGTFIGWYIKAFYGKEYVGQLAAATGLALLVVALYGRFRAK